MPCSIGEKKKIKAGEKRRLRQAQDHTFNAGGPNSTSPSLLRETESPIEGMDACMQRGLALRRYNKRISLNVRTVECWEEVPKRAAVPTSEIKISTSAERRKRKEERGEGRGERGGERGERGEWRGEFGVAVPCATRVTFQVFHLPQQFLLFVREVRRKETLQLELLLLGL